MNKAHKLLLFLSFFNATYLTAQNILWERSLGGAHMELLADVVPTADYGFILAGSSLSNKTGTHESSNQGDFDYWIYKMDENGESRSAKCSEKISYEKLRKVSRL
jgi:hypothetical protein